MGALGRTAAAIGLGAAAVVGISACEPGTGGPSPVAVAMTTDRTGTRALEHQGVAVRWMSCTAKAGEGARATDGTRPAATATTGRRIVSVTCEGETGDGQEIRVDGKVTDERDGRCVRGDLTARVGDRTVFQADVLGDCHATPTATPTRTGGSQASPVTHRPAATATVTVTTTVTAEPAPAPDPGPGRTGPPSK
ncbi:hypothetical protein BGM19_13975 [Streptomyces agglomeratus]|uniref:Lipoprotein n=2 Tax=Streptomyces agglomeratus TaxID=285458 RepID=A0A1E5PBL9_9ACTN|nr:hypothetical protein AS594_23135 [Streptomyces agglomeratus]OEJ51535.1 hypothetical protein BGK72_12875 [Streptomyces agglomeratus]OEJ58937.1 hypothetical protein BGM19_13975 [Streptomyces agglomeratus]